MASSNILKVDCSSVSSAVNALNNRRNEIKNLRSILSALSVEDSSALQIIRNIDLLDEKLNSVIKSTQSFVSSVDSYEDIKDNEDFTIKEVVSTQTPSTPTISKAEIKAENLPTEAKKITISSSKDTLWSNGADWQKIFRDSNGNVITQEKASKLRIGDTIYLVGLTGNATVPVSNSAEKTSAETPTTKSTSVNAAHTCTDQASLNNLVENNPKLLNGKKSCMVYARERANIFYKEEYNSYFGDSRGISSAKDFDNAYQNLSGYTVSNTPRVGSIMVFEANRYGAYSSGHAAFVESISADGKTIVVSESNWSGSGIQVRTITNADTLSGVSYVYKNI